MMRGVVLGGSALLVILLLVSVAPGSGTEVEAVMDDPWEPITDLNSRHVQNMAKYAVNQYNAQANTNLKLKRVVMGESRSAWITNHLILEVTPAGYFDAYVNWLDYRNLISFNPTSEP